jgi:hypothetical protein
VHANGPDEALWRVETLALSGAPVPAEAVRRMLLAAVGTIDSSVGEGHPLGGVHLPGRGRTVTEVWVVRWCSPPSPSAPACRSPQWRGMVDDRPAVLGLAAVGGWAIVSRRRRRVRPRLTTSAFLHGLARTGGGAAPRAALSRRRRACSRLALRRAVRLAGAGMPAERVAVLEAALPANGASSPGRGC